MSFLKDVGIGGVKNPLDSLGLTSAPGSLQDFYNKIGSNWSLSKQKYSSYINAPALFDINFKNFTPSTTFPITNSNTETNKKPETGNNDTGFFKTISNALSNVWESVKNNIGDDTDKNSLESALAVIQDNLANDCSIIPTLSKDWLGVDLDADIKYYVQSVTLPSVKIDLEYINNFSLSEPIGKDGSFVIPENNNITLNILDMVAPLSEYIFYPWLAEAGCSEWMYNRMPFTKADICISFLYPTTFNPTNNSVAPTFQYIFKNCYPTNIETLNPSQDSRQNFTRSIDFAFSHFIIKPSYIVNFGGLGLNNIAGVLGTRIINPLMNRGLQPITGNNFIPSTSL